MKSESELLEGAGMTPDEATITMLREKLDRYAIALAHYGEPGNWTGGGWRTLVSEPANRDQPGWKIAEAAMARPRLG